MIILKIAKPKKSKKKGPISLLEQAGGYLTVHMKAEMLRQREAAFKASLYKGIGA